MNRIFSFTLVLLLILVVLAACGQSTSPLAPTQSGASHPTGEPAATAATQAQIPNPASQNCIDQGGTLSFETRGDGGQFGVCYFEDNRQCEEWALFRGECPTGGLKVTGYVTPAARYCAITGGQYQITGGSNTDREQGTCTFKNGKSCDVWELWNGVCSANTGTSPATFVDPFAYCASAGTIDAPDARYTGPALPDSVRQAMIRQGIVTADAPLDFQNNAVWRCMDGRLWLCHFGANLPCEEKADTSQVATADMNAFCAANPGAEVIPEIVTGRATVYEWRCTAGTPAVVKQLFTPDAQGYLSEFWYQLSPQ
jgi:hypothetical protein